MTVAALGWYAPKDFRVPGWKRGVVQVTAAAAGIGASALLQSGCTHAAQSQRPHADLQFAQNVAGQQPILSIQDGAAEPDRKPLGVATLIAIFVAVLAVVLLPTIWIDRKVPAWLAKKGVRYPHTAWGLVNAAVAAAAVATERR